MLWSTFVALSAAIVARTCRYNAMLTRIWSTVATLAVFLVVYDMSMSWSNSLGRVASIGSTVTTLSLLRRLIIRK